MNQKRSLNQKRSITDWEWTTLVASWRYYEHRHTRISDTFPHEIVKHFFMGAYDYRSCKRIARQFVEIDHRCGPDDKMDGWVKSNELNDEFGGIDNKAWRLFYFYLCAWICGFPKARLTMRPKSGLIEVFLADGKWYSRVVYEKFGANADPYEDGAIEFFSK